jgi:DnaJ-class molecular chaperone
MFVICRACGGEGIWDVQVPGGWDEPDIISEACSTCGGSGQCEEVVEPRTYANLADEDAEMGVLSRKDQANG